MAVLDTGDLVLPDKLINPWLEKIQGGSVIATLSNSVPMTYGTETAMTFDWGEAEYVGEGANKGPSTFTTSSMTTKPHKFQKTIRWTEEVKWADEDAQLNVVSQSLDHITPALSRALDFGVIHGINPMTGLVVAAMTDPLSSTTNSVEMAAQAPYEMIDAADLLVVTDNYVPDSLALDPSFAAQFTTARTSEGVKKYPEFALSTDATTLEGHRASTSRTVGAVGVADTATNLKGLVGDFDTVRWGVQRRIGIEMIEFGDPDGQGDLKRNNQIAFRLEVLYGWGVADLDALAQIVDAV